MISGALSLLPLLLTSGPRRPRRGQDGIARRGRAMDRAAFANVQGGTSSEPRHDLANRRVAAARLPGCISFGYFSLCKQRKVTRALDARGKAKGRANRGSGAKSLDSRQEHAGMTSKKPGAIVSISCARGARKTHPYDSRSRGNDERKAGRVR